jgi:hypothetical protein
MCLKSDHLLLGMGGIDWRAEAAGEGCRGLMPTNVIAVVLSLLQGKIFRFITDIVAQKSGPAHQ